MGITRCLQMFGAGLLALALMGAADSAPAAEKDCVMCHEQAESGNPGRLRNQPPALCLNCHPDRVGSEEHRVGVRVPDIPKENLPLADGTVSCTTCHDPHARSRGMLRLPVARLCVACHDR